jgi:hypothetical protein
VYYPTVVADGMTPFDQTLDRLLSCKRTLAGDILKKNTDIDIADFVATL